MEDGQICDESQKHKCEKLISNYLRDLKEKTNLRSSKSFRDISLIELGFIIIEFIEDVLIPEQKEFKKKYINLNLNELREKEEKKNKFYFYDFELICNRIKYIMNEIKLFGENLYYIYGEKYAERIFEKIFHIDIYDYNDLGTEVKKFIGNKINDYCDMGRQDYYNLIIVLFNILISYCVMNKFCHIDTNIILKHNDLTILLYMFKNPKKVFITVNKNIVKKRYKKKNNDIKLSNVSAKFVNNISGEGFNLKSKIKIQLTNNGSIYYIIPSFYKDREKLITKLNDKLNYNIDYDRHNIPYINYNKTDNILIINGMEYNVYDISREFTLHSELYNLHLNEIKRETHNKKREFFAKLKNDCIKRIYESSNRKRMRYTDHESECDDRETKRRKIINDQYNKTSNRKRIRYNDYESECDERETKRRKITNDMNDEYSKTSNRKTIHNYSETYICDELKTIKRKIVNNMSDKEFEKLIEEDKKLIDEHNRLIEEINKNNEKYEKLLEEMNKKEMEEMVECYYLMNDEQSIIHDLYEDEADNINLEDTIKKIVKRIIKKSSHESLTEMMNKYLNDGCV